MSHDLMAFISLFLCLRHSFQMIVNRNLSLIIYFCSASDDFQSAVIFERIEEALKGDGKNLVNKVKGIFAFKVKDTNGNEGVWVVDAKNGSGSVEFGSKGDF